MSWLKRFLSILVVGFQVMSCGSDGVSVAELDAGDVANAEDASSSPDVTDSGVIDSGVQDGSDGGESADLGIDSGIPPIPDRSLEVVRNALERRVVAFRQVGGEYYVWEPRWDKLEKVKAPPT